LRLYLIKVFVGISVRETMKECNENLLLREGLKVVGISVVRGEGMAHRKNVAIKSKYETLEDCRENCRDIKKRLTLPIPASGKIYGEFYEDDFFVLSSRKAKTSVIFEFVGKMEECEDGIYLVGEIRAKEYQKWLLYGFSILFHMIGIAFIAVGTPGWIAYGVFLLIAVWIYILFVWKSDSLYHDLIRKVQDENEF
jgi:hypothetical protein